jgi:hypothetical protein
MLVLILVLLAVVAFAARFFVSDGRLTAAGGLLLCIALVLGSGVVTP